MEIWVDIIGFENYQVSNLGNVKRKKCIVLNKNNLQYSYEEKILKPEISRGYLRCTLSSKNIQKRFLIHRLVSIHFIENYLNKPCVNHIDGDKLNNNVNNLEWVTYSENERHSYKILKKTSHNRKLSETDVEDIRYNCSKGKNGNVNQYMIKYNVCRNTIISILNKKYYV